MDGIYIALICIGCALFIALTAIFLWASNNLIHISRYVLTSEKVGDEGLRIVHLSDLHAKKFGKGGGRLFKKVKSLNPDFIAFTGDIIHKYRPRDIAVAEETVSALCKIAPVYYVSGNHEMRSKRYRELKNILIDAGAHVLDDECENAFGVKICGVNCASIKSGKYFSLDRKEDGAEGGLKILLAHFPQYITRYAAAGYDVVLCGHAHGGQWRIPFTDIGFYSPGQGLLPKYTSGVHSCGNTKEVISRGLGNSECPIRLFNRPEIVVVDIVKSK